MSRWGKSWRALAAVSLFACPAAGALEESPALYRISAQAAAPLLPEPIRGFFSENLSEWSEAAASGIAAPSRNNPGGLKPGAHYIKLDVASLSTRPDDRLEALLRFPKDAAGAKQLFNRHAETRGGALPFEITERYRQLITAFDSGDREAIVRTAGLLLHLATDAALPLNTTTHRDGWMEGRLAWPAGTRAAESSHRTVRHRCQNQLVERFEDRFAFEVRVASDRLRPIGDVSDGVFDTLLRAHESLDVLLDVEGRIVTALDIENRDGFMAAIDEYYTGLEQRAAWIIRSRLQDGALLGARLVASAWWEAGSPSPQTFVVSSERDRKGASSADAAAGFVGSRKSKIFHFPHCPHAGRITPANLIRFDSLEKVRSAGRQPCKTCKPPPAGH